MLRGNGHFDLAQKGICRLQERLWAFLVGYVAAVGDDHQLGAGDLRGQANALLGGYDTVVVTGDN